MLHFPTDHPGAVAAFKAEATFTLHYSRDRLLHCIAQLTPTQFWQRPGDAAADPPMNAVGNTVLHVCGNLRQWIVIGCDPDEALTDNRDRPSEFSADATSGLLPEAAATLLRDTVDAAAQTIARLNKDHLLETRSIQGFAPTRMGAVWHSVAHLEGHAQETVFATRMMLGAGYRFKDLY